MNFRFKLYSVKIFLLLYGGKVYASGIIIEISYSFITKLFLALLIAIILYTLGFKTYLFIKKIQNYLISVIVINVIILIILNYCNIVIINGEEITKIKNSAVAIYNAFNKKVPYSFVFIGSYVAGFIIGLMKDNGIIFKKPKKKEEKKKEEKKKEEKKKEETVNISITCPKK